MDSEANRVKLLNEGEFILKQHYPLQHTIEGWKVEVLIFLLRNLEIKSNVKG